MQGRKLCKNSNQQIAFTPKLKTISGFLKVWGGGQVVMQVVARRSAATAGAFYPAKKLRGNCPPAPPSLAPL
jgi:hypothetical protein